MSAVHCCASFPVLSAPFGDSTPSVYLFRAAVCQACPSVGCSGNHLRGSPSLGSQSEAPCGLAATSSAPCQVQLPKVPDALCACVSIGCCSSELILTRLHCFHWPQQGHLGPAFCLLAYSCDQRFEGVKWLEYVTRSVWSSAADSVQRLVAPGIAGCVPSLQLICRPYAMSAVRVFAFLINNTVPVLIETSSSILVK